MKNKILALGLAYLILTSVSFAETKMGTINKGKSLLWSFYTDYSNQIMATAMWNKWATDLNLAFFILDENDEVMIIGAGLAETELFEQVTVGIIEFNEIYVMLLSNSGPQAKYQLNVQCAKSETLYKESLNFIGEFDEKEQSTSSMATIAKKAINELNRIRNNFR